MGRRRRPKKDLPSGSKQVESEFVVCKTSDVFGRFLEAKTNIGKGTLILSEKCLVAGPLRSSDSVCLGCHVGVDLQDRNTTRCPRCSWPMCSKKCSDSIFHVNECKFFVQRSIRVPERLLGFDFGLIAILRGLLLKINDSSGWDKLMLLEPHNEMRKLLPLWNENQENIVRVICEKWSLSDLFTPEDVHTVCGILEVNAFEMGETYSFRGIFPNSAMLAHDCIPNVTRFENSVDGIIDIRAATDIPEGSPIYLSYAFTLQPTPLRRKMLVDTKFFHCNCSRCSDPEELGSHFNTLICQVCKTGFLLNGGKNGDSWSCNQCENRIKRDEVEKILLIFGSRSQDLTDIQSQEKFLRECLSVFHPTHFIPFGVKFNLCQAYGRQGVDLMSLTQSNLERKSEVCSEVLRVLNIVCPGYNITRGLVLYEYQAAETALARRIFEARKFNKTLLRRKLQNILEILLESITILKFSHHDTVEYKMGQAAEDDSVIGLHRWISLLK